MYLRIRPTPSNQVGQFLVSPSLLSRPFEPYLTPQNSSKLRQQFAHLQTEEMDVQTFHWRHFDFRKFEKFKLVSRKVDFAVQHKFCKKVSAPDREVWSGDYLRRFSTTFRALCYRAKLLWSRKLNHADFRSSWTKTKNSSELCQKWKLNYQLKRPEMIIWARRTFVFRNSTATS